MFLKKMFILLSIILYPHKTDSISVMSVDMGSEWLKVAIVKPGVPMEIVLNKQTKRKTPFALSMKGNEREFGDPAFNVAIKQPNKAYIYLTHLLGKKYNSEAVKDYKRKFPHYTLLEDKERGTVLFQGEDDQLHSVEELVSMMLNFTRQIATDFASHPMKDIVLTVPVYYNQAERRSLLSAANMTGMNVLQLMNDNTAVALNYGIFRANTFNATVKNVMFYDMGSSHTTATIISYSTTKVKDRGYVETVPQLVVKGVGFDTNLGGLEMDLALRLHFIKYFKENMKTKKEITENPRAMAKLLKEARRVRQVLSANTDHQAQIENIFEEKNFKMKVTRGELEEMCADLFARVTKPVKMALDASSIPMTDIESIVLMGGGSRMPKVQQLLLDYSGKKELAKNINTDEAAALGAVYKGADLTKGFKVKRFIVKDLNLFPIDVQFERKSIEDEEIRFLNRNLYHRLNPLPQKKIMTFNKKPSDFSFNVSYGDLSFLSKDLAKSLTLEQLSHVKLSGVDTAHKNNEKATPKGVKAYFNLDDSGLLHVEKVEAHFEKTPEMVEEEEQSTFAKLGSKLSSFFGSSKTEEEPVTENKEELKEDSKEDAKESKGEKKADVEKDKGPIKEGAKSEDTEKKPDTKDDLKTNTTATNTTDTKRTNGTEKAKPTKPAIIKESISVLQEAVDVPSLPKEKFIQSVQKLNDLEARDQAKFATEKAYNNLESYLFETKDLLDREDVQKLSTSDEREELLMKLKEVSEWLDEYGFESDEKTLKKKRKESKELASDLMLRIKESEERPKAIASFLQSLNMSSIFMKSITEMPDAKEIFTDKDIQDIEKIYNESKDWLMANWKKQNETDPTKKPVILSKDILSQQGKLDRELMYIINKAKYYVPKPKPKPKNNAADPATNKTSTSEKSDKIENTVTNEEQIKSENEEEEEGKPAKEPAVSELDSAANENNVHTESNEELKGIENIEKESSKEKEEVNTSNEKVENNDKKNGPHQPEDEL